MLFFPSRQFSRPCLKLKHKFFFKLVDEIVESKGQGITLAHAKVSTGKKAVGTFSHQGVHNKKNNTSYIQQSQFPEKQLLTQLIALYSVSFQKLQSMRWRRYTMQSTCIAHVQLPINWFFSSVSQPNGCRKKDLMTILHQHRDKLWWITFSGISCLMKAEQSFSKL